ncbi:aminotransferase [Rhizobium binxianense]
MLRNAPDLEELDKKYLFHPFTALADHEKNGPIVIVKGEGVWLEDNHGRRYIDGMAGLWCVNVGYGRTEIADVLREQAVTLPYFHSFSSWGTDMPVLLAEKVIGHAPEGMSKVFFGQSGSDANDTQVKLVWYYWNSLGKPRKKKIIARRRGYHGVTIVSGSLTGMASLHSGFDLPLPFVRHTTPPYRLWEAEPGMSDADFVARLAGDLEQLILAEDPETIGAMIMEPVMGAGGVIVPPPGYYDAIQAVLAKYDILLIADEVISGFGRLGEWFGSTVVGMKPDLITVAKGITSAYVPLSGCIVSEKVWRTIVDGQAQFGPFGHGYTYSAHPLAAAAALANLQLIEEGGLIAQAASRGAHLHRRLQEAFADHPLVGDIRGRSLVGALEFVAAKNPMTPFDPALKIAARIVKQARDRGIITRALPHADTISFSPPFIITEAEIDEMIAKTREAVDATMDELVREKIWSN